MMMYDVQLYIFSWLSLFITPLILSQVNWFPVRCRCQLIFVSFLQKRNNGESRSKRWSIICSSVAVSFLELQSGTIPPKARHVITQPMSLIFTVPIGHVRTGQVGTYRSENGHVRTTLNCSYFRTFLVKWQKFNKLKTGKKILKLKLIFKMIFSYHLFIVIMELYALYKKS